MGILDYSKIADYFYYDETSPSCLRWAVGSGYKKVGDIAGNKAFNKNGTAKCWDVRANYVLYKAHRIIAQLLLELDSSSDLVINHIDNNPHNNKIDNLEIVEQSNNMRKTSAHTGKALQVNNKSGYNGVSEIIRNGKLYGYQAQVRNISGDIVAHVFSVPRYGEELALHLAKACRDFKIDELRKQGLDYSIKVFTEEEIFDIVASKEIFIAENHRSDKSKE